MASGMFTPALEKIAKGTLNLDTADLRMKLEMANFVFATDRDAATISALTTHDLYNGTNYVDKDLGDPTVTRDDTNNRAEVSVADVTYSALGGGTRNSVGALIYVYVDGTAGNDYPVGYVEWAVPWNGSDGDIIVHWNAEGLLQVGG